MPSVFVSIANYRDPEIENTVRTLIENTTGNLNLNIHVLSQCYSEECVELPSASDKGRIVVTQKFVTPEQSRGACWARAEIQREYSGEDFYLQLDLHVLMAPGWDEIILEDYANAEDGRPVVLTAYLPPYELANGQRLVRHKRPMHFRVVWRGRLPAADPLLGYPHARPCRAFFFAGGFAFARGRFVEDVPYDPEIFFDGEEISIALRAYCCGYDLCTPSRYVGAHLYQEPNAGRRPVFWNAQDDGKRSLSWAERDKASKMKVRSICRGEWRGLYGIRDTSRYEEFCRLLREHYGVDLKHVGLRPSERSQNLGGVRETAPAKA